MNVLSLRELPERLWISRLSASAEVPDEASGSLWSVTRTDDEVSVIGTVAHGRSEGPWIAFRVLGQLDFSLTGVVASLTAPLAEATISVFVLSTFDTDYLLVREETKSDAVAAWRHDGFTVELVH